MSFRVASACIAIGALTQLASNEAHSGEPAEEAMRQAMVDYSAGMHPVSIVDLHKERLTAMGYDLPLSTRSLIIAYSKLRRATVGYYGDRLAEASHFNPRDEEVKISGLVMWDTPVSPSPAYRSLGRRQLRIAMEETIHLLEHRLGGEELVARTPAYADYLRTTGAPFDGETLASAMLDEMGLPFSRAEVMSRGKMYPDRVAYRDYVSKSGHATRLARIARATRPALGTLRPPHTREPMSLRPPAHVIEAKAAMGAAQATGRKALLAQLPEGVSDVAEEVAENPSYYRQLAASAAFYARYYGRAVIVHGTRLVVGAVSTTAATGAAAATATGFAVYGTYGAITQSPSRGHVPESGGYSTGYWENFRDLYLTPLGW